MRGRGHHAPDGDRRQAGPEGEGATGPVHQQGRPAHQRAPDRRARDDEAVRGHHHQGQQPHLDVRARLPEEGVEGLRREGDRGLRVSLLQLGHVRAIHGEEGHQLHADLRVLQERPAEGALQEGTSPRGPARHGRRQAAIPHRGPGLQDTQHLAGRSRVRSGEVHDRVRRERTALAHDH